jgi:hypothetical protein
MRQVFVFEKVAVIVAPWHEPGNPPERGTRLEVRLLADEPARGSQFAAERVVIDTPVFRADLFDQVDAPAGNLRSAHFHPHFDGIEPCDRHWEARIKSDPTGWLADELRDLPGLLQRGGANGEDPATIARDAVALRAAIPAITAAVETVWQTVRTEVGVRQEAVSE